ncbi:transglutaminase family protein [Ruminococcus sp. OA3]|uniref:transglutaminase-like domain-containing protein n=1 Tax=Ruminococcus sp. OA3 TaxID=2914164 RepID=UPI001F0651CA|nr:transglutaminase family protein [Ruminococcus sp. OA3]MCH1981951.1 transglutaminase family protein [Ruminococcus sp. OA3]
MSETKRKSKKKNQGLNMEIVQELSAKGRFLKGLNEAGSVFVLYAGIMLSLLSMFAVPKQVWGAAAGGVAVMVLLLAGGKLKKAGYVICTLLFAAFLIVILLKRTPVYQGLLLVCNDALAQLGHHLGVMKDAFEVTAPETLYFLCYVMFVGTVSVFLALICYSVAESRNNYLLFLLLLPLLVLQMVSGVSESSWPLLLLLLGIILSIAASSAGGTNTKKNAGITKNAALAEMLGMLAVIFMAVLLILQAALPVTSYQTAGFVTALREKIHSTIENIRYEKDKTNSFTQGQFIGLKDLKLTDKTALKVVMDKPTSMYLKGYVGSVYTSEGWEETDKPVFYENKELLAGLHEKNFNALTQLPDIYRLEKPDTEDEKVKIKIQNVNAGSKYIYVPYELESDPNEIGQSKVLGDERIMAKGLFGNRLYQYQTSFNMVRQYPQIATEYYNRKDENEFSDYAQAESYYNAYVYQQYTEVSPDMMTLLQTHLKMEPAGEGTHLAYEDANAAVMGYLNKKITYSEEITEFTGGDFLKNFLEVSAKGYSVHYATAATMMYRYFGIPARYVEGYLITPELVKDAESYDEISVTGKEAHAWVEIYQDGIGWVPMEVTPPYLDKMERPDYEIAPSSMFGDDGEQGGARDGESEQMEDDTPDTPPDEEKQKKKEASRIGFWVLMGALTMLALWLLLFIIYILAKRHAMYKELKAIKSADDRTAVCLLGRYLEKWLCYAGLWNGSGSRYEVCGVLTEHYGEAVAQEYRHMVDIVQKGAYSDRDISGEERREAVEFTGKMRKNILKKTKFRKKIRMKLWDFMY